MATELEESISHGEVPVAFEDAREEELIRVAVVGRDAQDFFYSPLGRFVLGTALQDTRDIEQQLTRIKPNTPWRRRKITELQNEHRSIKMAIAWLNDAIRTGDQAETELNLPQE